MNPPQSPAGRILIQAGMEVPKIKAFRDHFEQSGFRSIDAFIQTWEEWEPFGKLVIAALLLEKEARSVDLLFKQQGEFYRRLLHGIKDDEELSRDHLAIISFNYDRSLEYYLQRALPMAVNLEAKELMSRLKALPILHFYGSLGSAWQGEEAYVEYGDQSFFAVTKAAAQIHLIGRRGKDLSEAARKVWREAEVIAFMGFGYDKENLRRLGFDGSGLWDANVPSPRIELLMHGIEHLAFQKALLPFAGFNRQPHALNILQFLDRIDLFE
jgi:hypothetical protein